MPSSTISVSYEQGSDKVQLEVHAGKTAVFSGNWSSGILLNGKLLLPDGEWKETYSHCENDCDFLEIALPLTEDYFLRRFFLLDHKDKVLLLGDTVLQESEDAGNSGNEQENCLTYSTELPVSENLQMRKKSKSGTLIYRQNNNQKKNNAQKDNTQKDICRLFPFFVQHNDCGYGNFSISQTGSSLFAAFCIDLNPKRFDTDCVWKRLTVGEDRQEVPPDKAAAYHFQLGKRNFLIYRSMTAAANRTFFGHNLIDDFCFAGFDAKSGTEVLMSCTK